MLNESSFWKARYTFMYRNSIIELSPDSSGMIQHLHQVPDSKYHLSRSTKTSLVRWKKVYMSLHSLSSNFRKGNFRIETESILMIVHQIQ